MFNHNSLMMVNIFRTLILLCFLNSPTSNSNLISNKSEISTDSTQNKKYFFVSIRDAKLLISYNWSAQAMIRRRMRWTFKFLEIICCLTWLARTFKIGMDLQRKDDSCSIISFQEFMQNTNQFSLFGVNSFLSARKKKVLSL